MQIRNVKNDDLNLFKSLVENKSYFESNNIWLEQSKVCEDEKGNILGFGLIKPNSLSDFFSGEIPANENVPEERKWYLKEDIEYLGDKQYEVLFYIKDETYVDNYILQLDLQHGVEDNINGVQLNAVLWTKSRPQYMTDFCNFNDIVYVCIPILEIR